MLFRSPRLLRRLRPASAARLGGVLVAAACGTSNFAQAAPVTFRFEAQISNVIKKGTPLPFPVDLGEQISGTFSFQPVDLDTSPEHPAGQFVTYEQNFSATYHVGQVDLSLPFLIFQSRDDSAADDSGALSDLLSHRFDQCVSIDCAQASLTGVEGYRLESVSLIMTGPSNLLNGPDLPESLDTWNSFTVSPSMASVTVSFISLDGNDSIKFHGAVSSFHVVPESSTWTTCLMALFSCAVIRPLVSRKLPKKETGCKKGSCF